MHLISPAHAATQRTASSVNEPLDDKLVCYLFKRGGEISALMQRRRQRFALDPAMTDVTTGTLTT